MKNSFKGRKVVIIGASGGLGAGFSKAFAEAGAKLLMAARNEEKLKLIAENIIGDVTLLQVNITDNESVGRLAEFAANWSESIDIVVNASGMDVRKAFKDHTTEEIRNTLEINLMGAMLITKAFIPLMKNHQTSTIVHIGGFADGRMAFPYYSVDVASRAGVYTFIEAVNRELKIEEIKTRVTYFCPSPADTEAERPFHVLWKKMGVIISPVEKVAMEMMKTIEKQKNVGIMGGFSTILFTKINSVLPKLSDVILMKKYGKMLQEYLYPSREIGTQKVQRHKSKLLPKIGIFLVALSTVLYGLIIIVPFTPLTIAQKAVIIPALIVSGEATWWVGLAIVGKQAITKYRKYLNPCNWFTCKKKNYKDINEI